MRQRQFVHEDLVVGPRDQHRLSTPADGLRGDFSPAAIAHSSSTGDSAL
jgi:hypothetical protein